MAILPLSLCSAASFRVFLLFPLRKSSFALLASVILKRKSNSLAEKKVSTNSRGSRALPYDNCIIKNSHKYFKIRVDFSSDFDYTTFNPKRRLLR